MKALAITLFCICANLLSYSQTEYKNFKILNSELIWEKVFEEGGSGIMAQIKQNPNVNILGETETRLTGTVKDFFFNYKKYGGTLMGVPHYTREAYNFNFTVEVKEHRYRVVVSKIAYYSTIYTDSPVLSPLDQMVLRKQNTQFVKYSFTGLVYMDMELVEVFTVGGEVVPGDW